MCRSLGICCTFTVNSFAVGSAKELQRSSPTSKLTTPESSLGSDSSETSFVKRNFDEMVMLRRHSLILMSMIVEFEVVEVRYSASLLSFSECVSEVSSGASGVRVFEKEGRHDGLGDGLGDESAKELPGLDAHSLNGFSEGSDLS